MTAIDIGRRTDFAGLYPSRGTYPIKAAVNIKKGAKVGVDSAGRAMPADTIANGCLKVVGKASAAYDNRSGSALGGAADSTDVEVEYGVFGWDNSGITDDDIGSPSYAVDDETSALSSSSGTRPNEGIISEVRDGQAYIWMGPGALAASQALSLANAGVSLQKRSVTVGHADLTDADTSQDINIGAVLPANARILGVELHTATAFSGGTVSALKLDVGTSGDVDALVAQADLFAAVVDGQAASRPNGIAPNKLFAAGGAQLSGRFTSTGDNLVNLSAGSITIDVLFAVLA